MDCPYCEGSSRVADSRPTADGIRRRRVCSDCKRRFTTYERVGNSDIRVTKRGGRPAESFDLDKLRRVIARVVRGRPVSADAPDRIARLVEGEILDGGSSSVTSWRIADLLLARLRELDGLAHGRFAVDYTDDTGRIRTEPRDEPDDADLPQLGLFGDPDAGVEE